MIHRAGHHTIGAFIAQHRDQVRLENQNTFTLAFHQCARYYSFLEIIEERYILASTAFVEIAQGLTTGKSTYEQADERSNRLHLEIESFYLFSKLLLDRAAEAFAYFFGFRWGGKGSTHSKLVEQYAGKRQFHKWLPEFTVELTEALRDLKLTIVEHKTDIIEHMQDANIVHSTTFSLDGKISRIVPVAIGPDAGRSHINFNGRHTLTPEELFPMIDGYLNELFSFLHAQISISPLTKNL